MLKRLLPLIIAYSRKQENYLKYVATILRGASNFQDIWLSIMVGCELK
jgi:hypothetical protein